MAELGIDIADNQPRVLSRDDIERSDVVVTMGCGDTCPIVPGTRYLDWELDDPAGKTIAQVRTIRDQIERLVRGLLADLSPEA